MNGNAHLIIALTGAKLRMIRRMRRRTLVYHTIRARDLSSASLLLFVEALPTICRIIPNCQPIRATEETQKCREEIGGVPRPQARLRLPELIRFWLV